MNPTLKLRGLRPEKGSPTLELQFEPGISCLVLAPEVDLDLLVRQLTGLRHPSRGRVEWSGQKPQAHSKLRAKLGSLFLKEEPEFMGPTVAAHLDRARQLRAQASGHQALEQSGLLPPELLKLAVQELSPSQRRLVALELALSTGGAQGLVLAKPGLELSGAALSRLLERCEQLRSQACICLFLEHELSTARRFAGRVVCAPGCLAAEKP